MYTPFKMKGKSPMMKALIGGQKNLAKQGAPELQAAIEAAPTKMYGKSPTKLTGKERRAAIEKAKSGTYDNAKAKRKAVLEARKKANKAFAEAKKKKVVKAVSNVNEKIQTGAKNLGTKLKSTTKIITKKEKLTNQQKLNAKNKGKGYSNATSVNALVKVRNRWRSENPGKKFPGQSEINKRLKANPGKFD